MPATSLSLSRKKVPSSPSLCHLLHGVDVDGEFSSVVIFFISNFSQHLFTVKLLFNWPCRPPSLSLSRQQEHATTIHVLLVAWGRQWRWVFLLFLFFPDCSNFFLTALFPVELLCSSGCYLLFPRFFLRLHLNFKMSHVSITICLPKHILVL